MARHILPPHLRGVDRRTDRPSRDDVRHAEYPNARSFPLSGAKKYRYLSGSSSMQFVLFEDRLAKARSPGLVPRRAARDLHPYRK